VVTDAFTLLDAAGLAWSVVVAVLPLVVLFLTFQVLFLKLPAREVTRIVAGTMIASTGLWLFLLGVNIGFLPAGRAIGEAIGSLAQAWLLVAVGLVLGFVTTWGEPAVRILADEVEEASGGSIRRALVVWTICLGVSAAAAAGMLRIAIGLPLLYLLVPGYLLAVAAIWLSEARFVGVAIDAGGVATGPLANTFLLALALGASAATAAADPLVEGLGMIALTALAPMLSVLALGVLLRSRTARMETER
jgi:hypothetical protein